MAVRAVILAAGEGARLGESVPPFHKPLIVVNGRTLVGAAADAVFGHVASTTVVVSPTNASAVCYVTGNSVQDYVVQPNPIGPGDALMRAMRYMPDDDQVLVIMGDNTVTSNDVLAILLEGRKSQNVVGVTLMPYPEALRFTRFLGDEWYEGQQREDEHYGRTDSVLVWLGPILMNVGELRKALRDSRSHKIGPAFSCLTSRPMAVHVECEDIGVPEVLP